MASKDDKPKTDWEAIEREYRAGELGVEKMAVDLLGNHVLWREMGWPDVDRVRSQVRIGRCIADIVVMHVDNSITVIEVKRSGLQLREYCTGIGQLAYQAIMAMSDFQTYKVRRVLAMPGQFPVDVAIACMADGVDMLPMPMIEEWLSFMRQAEQDLAA